MKLLNWNRLLAAVLVATLLPLIELQAAPEEFNFVELEELQNAPHRHWARGVVFKDVLTAKPGGRTIEVDDRRYVPFATRTLDCYVDVEDETMFKSLKKGKEYLFSGTVIHGKRKYLIAVSSVEETIADNIPPEKVKEALTPPAPDPNDTSTTVSTETLPKHLRTINELMETALTSMYVYTKEQDIALAELFNPDSEHSKRGMDTIRSTVRSMQKEGKTTSEEVLASLLRDMLEERYAPEMKDANRKDATAEPKPLKEEAAPQPLEVTKEAMDDTKASSPEEPVVEITSIDPPTAAPSKKDKKTKKKKSSPSKVDKKDNKQSVDSGSPIRVVSAKKATPPKKKKAKKKSGKKAAPTKKPITPPEPIVPQLDITAILDYIGAEVEVVLDDATKN